MIRFTHTGPHSVRSPSVFGVNSGLERTNGVEWAFPSGASGVGEIGLSCGLLVLGFAGAEGRHTNCVSFHIRVLKVAK
jgi:hypothetical protein